MQQFSNTYDDETTAAYAVEYYTAKGFKVDRHGLKIIARVGAA